MATGVLSQHGDALIAQDAPLFADYVVVDGTWEVELVKDPVENMNGASQIGNVSFKNPIYRAKCDWWVKSGEVAAVPSDIVAESSPGTIKWLVLTAPQKDFGKLVKQSVTLLYQPAVSGVCPAIPSQA